MTDVDGGTRGAGAGLPAAAALAAGRAALPDPGRAFVAGFGTGGDEAVSGERSREELSGLPGAWAEGRHVIVRVGPRLSAHDAADRLYDAGVSAETPALLASDLGTGRERLLYGSLGDVGGYGFGPGAILIVPHPSGLPMDFAWPPAAAPSEGRTG